MSAMRYQIVLVDAERKRVLVSIRQPGEKVCARMRWMKTSALRLSAIVNHHTLDFGRLPLTQHQVNK